MTTYPTYKLGDVAEIINGKNQKEVVSPQGKYPIYGSGGIIGWATDYLCKENSTIIGRKGTIDSPIFVNRKFWNVDTAFGIQPSEKVLPRYLFFFCKSFDFKKLDKSTTIPSLAKRDLLQIPIPLPPLPTQQAIVSRIETLFAELDKGMEHLRTAQQQIKTYRQAVLKAAFEGCDKFEKIIKHFDVTGGLTKNSQREKFPVKMPYLRVANVYYNRLDLSEIKEIGVQESEIKEKLLKKDDLLFVEGNGSKEQIGRVAIWNGSIENCLHQNHIIKGRPLGTTLSKFALYYFISDFGREQIIKVASSTSGLYTLSTEKVRNLNVPACSISEQQRIVAEIESRLSQAEAVEASIERALQQAEALRQSILKKAFNGELE
jgi:type I restriction enzyme S subunit